MSSVLDDLLGKKPQTKSVEICLDPDLGDELAEARRRMQHALRDAEKSPEDGDLGAAAAEAQDRYDELVAQMRKRIVRIVFQAIDPAELDQLKGEHRPTDEQRRRAQRDKQPAPEWNVDTFPPVLMAAACVLMHGPSGDQVGMSLEDAQRLWTSPTLNQVERAEIWNAAVAAQMKSTRVGDIPFG